MRRPFPIPRLALPVRTKGSSLVWATVWVLSEKGRYSRKKWTFNFRLESLKGMQKCYFFHGILPALGVKILLQTGRANPVQGGGFPETPFFLLSAMVRRAN